GDTRERIELLALQLLEVPNPELSTGIGKNECVCVEEDLDASGDLNTNEFASAAGGGWTHTRAVLQRVEDDLRPRLLACGEQELYQLCRGLAGRFVPPGPSGAPSRGRPDVLPTGRNFFSVDTRMIPTPTAWALGEKSAALLIERFVQDNGDYPRSLGLSVWGTATMRTGGDDIAQAFALIGVRPQW